MSILLAFAAAMLFGIGTYLVLQRNLSRIIIGVGLLSHGGNVLLIMAGRRGIPPLIGEGPESAFSDPLPQALTLTAIVITFGVTAFLLALAYRSWLLTRDDEVEHDIADVDIRFGRGTDDDDEDVFEALDDEDADAAEDDEGIEVSPRAEPGEADTAPPPDPPPTEARS